MRAAAFGKGEQHACCQATDDVAVPGAAPDDMTSVHKDSRGSGSPDSHCEAPGHQGSLPGVVGGMASHRGRRGRMPCW